MKVSYKKLWKILIDQDMKKRDLEKAAGKHCTKAFVANRPSAVFCSPQCKK